jgi:hypothetical protein
MWGGEACRVRDHGKCSAAVARLAAFIADFPQSPNRTHVFQYHDIVKTLDAKVKAMSQRDSAFTHVTACTLAKSPSDSLHQRLQQFRCSPCRSDCYRVERTSSRAGILPLWTATRAAAKNGILVDFRSVCADLTEPDNSHL